MTTGDTEPVRDTGRGIRLPWRLRSRLSLRSRLRSVRLRGLMTRGQARPAGEFANLDPRASSRLQVCFCLARSVLNKLEAMLKSQDAPHKNPDVRLPLKEGEF